MQACGTSTSFAIGSEAVKWTRVSRIFTLFLASTSWAWRAFGRKLCLNITTNPRIYRVLGLV